MHKKIFKKNYPLIKTLINQIEKCTLIYILGTYLIFKIKFYFINKNDDDTREKSKKIIITGNKKAFDLAEWQESRLLLRNDHKSNSELIKKVKRLHFSERF